MQSLKDNPAFITAINAGRSNAELYEMFTNYSGRQIRDVANQLRLSTVKQPVRKTIDISDSHEEQYQRHRALNTANSPQLNPSNLTELNQTSKLAQLMNGNHPKIPESSKPAGITVEQVVAPTLTDFQENGKYEFGQMADRARKYGEARAKNPPDFVEYRVKTDRPVLLTHFSDMHFGAEGTDYDRAEEDARLVGATPYAFALFGGDGIDNFIKHLSGIIASGTTPKQQVAALGYWLNLCTFLGGVGGNHEHWSTALAGIEPLRQLFRERKIVYSPFRLRLILHVNDIPYRIELRHNYRFKSTINLSNQFLRMWEMSDWEFDIGMLGHTHDGPFTFPFQRHGVERYGSLAGAYKIVDAHSEQWGFNHATPRSPCFILNHEEKEIIPLNCIRKGLKVLKGLTG